MKNPIILKDLFIWINGMMGKLTILIILFIVAAYCILSAWFGDFGMYYHYSSNNQLLEMGYILWGISIAIIAVLKWILSVVSEKSQQTYELIKISSISPTQYIIWKFFADVAYFWIILIMLLPFCTYFLFSWGIVFSDILLLFLHLLLIAWCAWAIGITIGSITKNLTLSFLISVISLILMFVFTSQYSVLMDIVSSILYIYDKNWWFFTSFFLFVTFWFLIYSIQKIKQETFANTHRYPVILTCILFICWAIVSYIFDATSSVIFILLGILDIILLFLNFHTFQKTEEKIFSYRFFLTVLFTVIWIVSFNFWSIKLISFSILILVWVALISVNVIEIYKRIQIYLQKFIYIIVLGFIFLVLPSFLSKLGFTLSDTLPFHLYIQEIWNTYHDIVEYEQSIRNEIYLQTFHEVYFYHIKTSFYYLYIMIVLMLLIYYTRHFFKK